MIVRGEYPMRENDKNKKTDSYDLMQDTQYLLLGLKDGEEGSYDLADILAEFGGEEKTAPVAGVPPASEAPRPVEEVSRDGSERRPQDETASHPKIIAFPGAAAVLAPENEDTRTLPPAEETVDFSPEELFALDAETDEVEDHRVDPSQFVELPEVKTEVTEEASQPRPLSMEDIVASTVDAVKAENERDQDEHRRRIEKERKKREKKRREPRVNAPLPETAEEQSPKEAAAFHKRRYLDCRLRLILAVPMLLLLWFPWLLNELGMTLPYFSDGAENAAVCVFIPQVLLSVICAPLFRAAIEEWKERCCTFYTYTALTNLITLLDEITLPALAGRSAVSPLGGVAGCAMVFAMWGLKNYHCGMWETFRTAAMGRPACVVDACESGIVRGQGSGEGFVTRAKMESTASQWQRLFLPVLTMSSLVFAVLSSVGQQRSHDFLWCWSVVLCASCSLVCPLTYCVPFGSIARRLSRSGTAVAGQYGAAALSVTPKLVVTDTDLFPRAAVLLSGVKLYGEERDHAISYTATLAVQGGGSLARVFETVCQNEHIPYQPLEHFHIHDDNGLSGMIRGETVLVGTPLFMRHKAVRLPATLPAKTAVCLAVDGELAAVFALKYSAHPPVETAVRSLARNGISLVLATRDGNVTPKLIKSRLGTDGKASVPEITDRLALSDPMREGGAPNGIIFREGILPYVELVALSRRLCHVLKIGNFLSVFGGIFGALLAFYLAFVGSTAVLNPVLLMTFLLLWVMPILPLLFRIDRI